MCLRLNTSAGATSASITVQRAALFAGAAMSKAHVTGRANTLRGATMINRRLLIYGCGGDIAPPLPDVDTDLWSTTEADEGGFYDTFDVVIPAGVNVVYVGGGINGSIVGEPCYCSMYSNFSGKTWFSASGEDSAGATNYIGVTPLKTYRITVDYGSEIDGTGGSAFIRYSQRINAVKPNLTDY